MQATGTVRTFGRGSVQLVIVAAVAVTGIAIGRWGIPADDAVTIATSPRTDAVSATDRFEAMAERKLSQMDARHAGHAHHTVAVEETTTLVPAEAANVASIPDSAVERKLAQTSVSSGAFSEQANVASIPESAVERKLAQTGRSSGALSEQADVASIPESAVERKLSRTSVSPGALSERANVASIPESAVERKLSRTSEGAGFVNNAGTTRIPDSAVERKLEQTGTGATATAQRQYDEMFETKSAQMDAREAR